MRTKPNTNQKFIFRGKDTFLKFLKPGDKFTTPRSVRVYTVTEEGVVDDKNEYTFFPDTMPVKPIKEF